MGRFRAKPVVIEAVHFVRWRGDVAVMEKPVPEWFKEAMVKPRGEVGEVRGHGEGAMIRTLEGVIFADPGDWIIRGTHGELYPCKPGPFATKYEPVA